MTHRHGDGPHKPEPSHIRQPPRAEGILAAETVRQWQETGELRHLYGRPLDLSDDSPEWLAHKLLRQEGFSHPLIERGNDLDKARRAAGDIIERVRRRRDWLMRPDVEAGPEQVRGFCAMRERALEDYRESLTQLNRAIRDYNLTAPAALHRRQVAVDECVAQAGGDVPLLPEAATGSDSYAAPSRWKSRWLTLLRRP